MVRLGLPKEPYWLDLPHGVRLKVRPLNTAMMEAQRAAARRLLGELRDELARRKEAGIPVDGVPDLEDDDTRAGYARMLLAKATARVAVIDWEGVLVEDGSGPAARTPENVAAVMEIDAIAVAFIDGYYASLDALVAEGNVSRPAPNGTTAAGPIIAPDAASTGAAAPMAEEAPRAPAALTSSTRP